MTRWSKKFDKCAVCEKTNKKHKGHGLCTGCYLLRWMNLLPRRKDRKKILDHRRYLKIRKLPGFKKRCFENHRKWKIKNPDVYKKNKDREVFRERVNSFFSGKVKNKLGLKINIGGRIIHTPIMPDSKNLIEEIKIFKNIYYSNGPKN